MSSLSLQNKSEIDVEGQILSKQTLPDNNLPERILPDNNLPEQILPEYTLSEYRNWYHQNVKINTTSDLSYFISLFDWYWMGNIFMSLPEKVKMLQNTYDLYQDIFKNGKQAHLQNLFSGMIQLSKKELEPYFKVEAKNDKACFNQQFIQQHVFCDDCFFSGQSFDMEGYINQFNMTYINEFNDFINGSLDRLKLYVYSQKLTRSTLIEFTKYTNEYIIITDPSIPQDKCSIICPLCDKRTQIQISDLIHHMEYLEASLNISPKHADIPLNIPRHNNCDCDQFFKVCVYGKKQQVFGLSMIDLTEFQAKQASVFNSVVQSGDYNTLLVGGFDNEYRLYTREEYLINLGDQTFINLNMIQENINLIRWCLNNCKDKMRLYNCIQQLLVDLKKYRPYNRLRVRNRDDILNQQRQVLLDRCQQYSQILATQKQSNIFNQMLQIVNFDKHYEKELGILEYIKDDNMLYQEKQEEELNTKPNVELILPIQFYFNQYQFKHLPTYKNQQNYLNEQSWLYFSAIPIFQNDNIFGYTNSLSEFVILNFGQTLNKILTSIVQQLNSIPNIIQMENGFRTATIYVPFRVQYINENNIRNIQLNIRDINNETICIRGRQLQKIEILQDDRLQKPFFELKIELFSHIVEENNNNQIAQNEFEMKIRNITIVKHNQNDYRENTQQQFLIFNDNRFNDLRFNNVGLQQLVYKYLYGHIYFMLQISVNGLQQIQYNVTSIYTIHGLLQYNILEQPLQHDLYIFPTTEILKDNNGEDKKVKNGTTISAYLKQMLLGKHAYTQLQQFNNIQYNPNWSSFKRLIQKIQVYISLIDINTIFDEIKRNVKHNRINTNFINNRNALIQMGQSMDDYYKLFQDLLLYSYLTCEELRQVLDIVDEQFYLSFVIKLRNSIDLVIKKYIIDNHYEPQIGNGQIHNQLYDFIITEINQNNSYLNENDIIQNGQIVHKNWINIIEDMDIILRRLEEDIQRTYY